MDHTKKNTVERSASLKRLIQARAKATLICLFLLSVLFICSLLLFSIFSEFGATQVVSDTPITIAVVTSAVSILIGAFITIAYIVWANSRLDPLTKDAIADLTQRSAS